MLRTLTILFAIGSATACMAGASIEGPEDGDLEANNSIQPYGDVDPVHLENGQPITVDIKFTNASQTASVSYSNISTFSDWICDYSYDVPNWVGGTWEVKVKISGVVVDTTSGDIIQPF